MRLLASVLLAWMIVIAAAPGFALPAGEEEVRVLILAQKPARSGKLDAMLAAARQAGVTADYRFVGEADVGISLSELTRVDLLVIDSPYVSKLAGVAAALDSTLKAWGKPVLFVPRRGYIPALHLGETHGRRLGDYYQHGGEKNRQHFFAYLKALLSGMDTASIPSPLLLPDAGIYHPDHQQGVFADTGAYFRWLGLKTEDERPVIGVAIHRSYLVDGIMNHIDASVRQLERSGALPLVYYHPARDGKAIKKLLAPKGKTIPHAIISYRAVFDAAISREAFGELGIPVLQALVHKKSEAHWKQDSAGWPFSRIPFYLAQPETAGIIDPMVVAVTEKGQTSALDVQLDSLVRKALRLAQLQRQANEKKRIAILYYNSPPGGTHLKASFLNVPRSLARILGGMSAAGYKVDPLAEDTLAERAQTVLEGYHHTDAFERLLASDLAVLLPLEDYLKWFEALPKTVQARITDRWGEPGESRMLIERKGRRHFIIPRMASGNIVILPQPLRGGVDDDQGALQHDRKLPLNHSYLATYLWLREHFPADALIHLGTHGTQEWAPGKERALAVSDDPFLAVGEVPVIYPFIVDDVGEAVQAKRRGRALIISHQTPPFRPAGLYHELSGLHELVQRYEELDSGPVKAETRRAILARVSRNGIYADMGWKDPIDTRQFPQFMEELHHYLHDLAEAQQPLGLHSFGQEPSAEHLTSTVMQMLGSDYLHAAGAGKEALAQDYQQLRDSHPFRLLHRFLGDGKPPEGSDENLRELLRRAAQYADSLRAQGELPGLLAALDGRFITARVGGDPIRNPAALPTGANLYSFDPEILPTPQAWEAGKQLVDGLIDDYHKRHGQWPEKIAFSLWSSEAMRHHGVIESQVLHALGVRPVWNTRGRVRGVEIVPYAELGRPRVDVVISATGLYRDTFEGAMRLIAEAVDKVAALKEEQNAIWRHSRRVAERLISGGMAPDQAAGLARVRVFAPESGAYGTGLSDAILDSGEWEKDDQVARLYLQRMQYAYGKDAQISGLRVEGVNLYAEMLSGTQAAVLARSSNLYGLLSSDDPYQNLGGLALAVRHLDGTSPDLFIANLRDPARQRLETVGRFLARELRARQFHPGWIKSMQAEGYAGTVELLDTFNNLWGWEVTAPEAVRDDQWNMMAEVYVADKYNLKLREWFEEHNPQALAQMIERLLEAARKGYWKAQDTTLRQLVEDYEALQKQHAVSSQNERFRQFLNEKLAGYGLTAPASQAAAADGVPEQAAQQVQGQRLEQVSQQVSDWQLQSLMWLALLLAVSAAGYLRQTVFPGK